MGTQWFPEVDADSELGQRLAAEAAKRYPSSVDVDNQITLYYDRDERRWYAARDDIYLHAPWFIAEHGLSFPTMSVSKNNIAIQPDSAYQGRYIGAGEWEDCKATVDNYVNRQNGGLGQIITVTGPCALVAGYYARIRSCQETPVTWWEPEPVFVPWWTRVWRAVIGRPTA